MTLCIDNYDQDMIIKFTKISTEWEYKCQIWEQEKKLASWVSTKWVKSNARKKKHSQVDVESLSWWKNLSSNCEFCSSFSFQSMPSFYWVNLSDIICQYYLIKMTVIKKVILPEFAICNKIPCTSRAWITYNL